MRGIARPCAMRGVAQSRHKAVEFFTLYRHMRPQIGCGNVPCALRKRINDRLMLGQ